MHVIMYGSSTVYLWRSAQLHDNGVAYFIEQRGLKLTYSIVYTVVLPITMIAYVVINESTVMLPVTFPVAHIMTIDYFCFLFFSWFTNPQHMHEDYGGLCVSVCLLPR